LPYPVFYLDSSAITKRYCFEAGTEFIDFLFAFGLKNPGHLFTAAHAIVEVCSAIYMKSRMKIIDPEEAYSPVEVYIEESVFALELIGTDIDLYNHALNYLRNHTLRAGDAIHISAAQKLYTQYETEMYFVSADNRQSDAAHAEGFAILNPSEDKAVAVLDSLLF